MRFRLIFVLLLPVSMTGFSQSAQTPYSSKGLGDLVYPGMVNNNGMGGISIAYPSNINYNLLNPALLSINSLTTFEVGFTGERRSISSDTLRQNIGAGNMSYLAIGFPLKSGFCSTGFSLAPFSYVNYNIQSKNPVNGSADTVYINFKGSGGVNSLSWSTGFLFFKSLAIGAKISYLFGSIIEETIVDLPKTSAYKTAYYSENNIRDFNLSLGFDYRIELSKSMSLNLGGIYETPKNLRVIRTEKLERRTPDTGVTISSDTIIYNQKGSVYVPEKIGAGLTLVKTGRWMFGLEYIKQNWSEFRNYHNTNDNMINSSRYAGGIEFIPNINSVSNYFSRVIYRAGFNYIKTPYFIDNADVNEYGINLGISLPVNRTSLVNLGFQFGQRGNQSELAINENYFRLSFGFTYNDKWFIRRRID